MDENEMTVKVGNYNVPMLDFMKVVFDSVIGDIDINVKGVEGWLLKFKAVSSNNEKKISISFTDKDGQEMGGLDLKFAQDFGFSPN